jgi:hypothetical protein
MTPARGRLDRRFHSILLEFPLKFEEGVNCTLEIAINGNPFRALCLRVDGVKVDRDIAVQVHSNGVRVQWLWVIGLVVARKVVRGLPIGKRLVPLNAVGAAVYELADEVAGGLPAYVELGVHSLTSLPEVVWL